MYWMRHGTSYSNVASILQSLSDRGDARACALLPAAQSRRRHPDQTELTPLGRIQGVLAGRALTHKRIAVDHLMASSLPRAIETADAVRRGLGTPNAVIHVVPYVHEVGNRARDPNKVIEFARRNGIRNVSVQNLMSEPRRHDPNIATFRRSLVSKNLEGTTLVVSHGNLMQDVTGGVLPRNTEIWADDGASPIYRPDQDTFLGGTEGISDLEKFGLLARE